MQKIKYRLYWAFHISEGTVFNYYKIPAREHPENTKEKSSLSLPNHKTEHQHTTALV
jgi:hypothetical protein